MKCRYLPIFLIVLRVPYDGALLRSFEKGLFFFFGLVLLILYSKALKI